jgi:uncharacterized glyoxalase superfamily protein PhnB
MTPKNGAVSGLDHLYLPTADFQAAWAFWTKVAGGKETTTWGDGAHRAGVVELGACRLVVAQETPNAGKGELGYDIVLGRPEIFLRCSGIDAVYEAMQKRGAAIVSPLHKTHWGPRAFSLQAPDGLIVSFIE